MQNTEAPLIDIRAAVPGLDMGACFDEQRLGLVAR